ncbi:hypothetical protein MO973_21150 [Paenibacillus sp. TRM 82003]|nr:hypothetical protein [Paenibacillus sp. TRM 82003]
MRIDGQHLPFDTIDAFGQRLGERKLQPAIPVGREYAVDGAAAFGE